MEATLLPKTNRLRQLIRIHGNRWIIERGPKPMGCFGLAEGFAIVSLDGAHKRNVRKEEMKLDEEAYVSSH